MDIGMKKTLSLSWEAALEAVPAALKAEGFGVLTLSLSRAGEGKPAHEGKGTRGSMEKGRGKSPSV